MCQKPQHFEEIMSMVGIEIYDLVKKFNSGVDFKTHCWKIRAAYLSPVKCIKYPFRVNKHTWLTGRTKFMKTIISRR